MAIHTWYDDTEDIATRRKTLTSKETDKQIEKNINNSKFRCHSVREKRVCVWGGGGGGEESENEPPQFICMCA